jgi:hypothetical protein
MDRKPNIWAPKEINPNPTNFEIAVEAYKEAKGAVDTTRQNAAVVLGRVQGLVVSSINYGLVERKKEIVRIIFDRMHGIVQPNKDSVEAFLLENSDIMDLISELMIIECKLMGRNEKKLPSSLNSYILVALSILIEDTPDLTYGVNNVSNKELKSYARRQTTKNPGEKYKNWQGSKKIHEEQVQRDLEQVHQHQFYAKHRKGHKHMGDMLDMGDVEKGGRRTRKRFKKIGSNKRR